MTTYTSLTPALYTFIVLVGPAIGSFVALLAERLPKGQSVVIARSCCRNCGAWLGWQDLVPLLSHMALRGRCRHCGSAIPQHLFLAELAGLAAGILAVITAAGLLEALIGVVFLWCLLGLILADLQAFRLPDQMTAALLLTGIAMAWLHPDRDIAGALVSAVLGAGVFWLLRAGYKRLRCREGLGLGDVKLMAGLGAALGAELLPLAVLLASLAGLSAALASVPRLGWQGALRGNRAIPFGAFLAVAAGAVWLAIP